MANNTASKRRQLARLFKIQNGLCFWCRKPMTLERPQRHQKPNPRMATIEHLDDRFAPWRGKFSGELRRVVACYECNNHRGSAIQAGVPVEVLRQRAGRGQIPLASPPPTDVPSAKPPAGGH